MNWRFWSRPAETEERAVTFDKIFGEMPVQSYSGKSVNESTALKYSVVWRSVSLIADAVSSLNPEASREDASGRVKPATLPRWISRPNPEMPRINVWHQLLVSVLLWGNGYALLIRRPGTGAIVGMRVLDPAAVQCEWDPDRPGQRRYRTQIDNKYSPWMSSASIFHIQGMTLPGQAKGLSVIGQAREAVGLGLTLEEFGARYFAQGSMAKVIIKVPGRTLDEKQAAEIVKLYERFHRGPGNWHRPAVLSGPSGTDIENISIPPNDAQFLESREFQALDVARWFGVPPHRVGIVSKQSSWGSGLAEENTALVQTTYRRYIMMLEAAFTMYSPGGDSNGLIIRLNDSALMRGTFDEQVKTFVSATGGPIMTVNEARAELGKEPIEGGDELRKPIAAPQDDPQNKPGTKKGEEDGSSQDKQAG